MADARIKKGGRLMQRLCEVALVGLPLAIVTALVLAPDVLQLLSTIQAAWTIPIAALTAEATPSAAAVSALPAGHQFLAARVVAGPSAAGRCRFDCGVG